MSKHKYRNRDNYYTTEDVEETVDVVEEKEPVIGVVTDCSKLNIRMRPSKNDVIEGVVNKGDTLTIDMDRSVSGWYRVTTETGVEGFCMKQYVTVK